MKKTQKNSESTNAKPALRAYRIGLGLAFASQFAALDFLVRGAAVYRDQPRMLGGLAASLALLALALRGVSANRLWLRVTMAAAVGSLIASALGYYRYYHAPLDSQTFLAARHAWADVKPMLVRGLPSFAGVAVLLTAIEFVWIQASLPVDWRKRWLGLVLLGGAITCGSLQEATAEFRMAGAMAALARPRAARTNGVRPSMPELTSSRVRLPHVLFIVTESVRASDSCLSHGCGSSPELDRLLPERTTFAEARSISSYTAIALSGIFTGQTQLRPRSELAQLPDVFDLARAVRAHNSAYSIRYWSSQMAGVIERSELHGVADDVVTAETLLGHPLSDIEDAVAAVLDRRVGEVCETRMVAGGKPQFTLIHLSGTHAPYAFDSNAAPFQPWKRQVTWSGLGELHNAYMNSIFEQDHTLGRCISAFMKTVIGQPWVVIYTSDHGEAFGEHSAIHHGQNLYDEQIRVPLILAHGYGALTPEQSSALRANSQHPVTHLDVVPTLLEIWGVNRHFALEAWASALPGQSLLAPLGPSAPLPISNCTELFPCPINTWGILYGHKKLTAQSWDGNWRCLSLAGAESERTIGDCSELVKAACGTFPRLPNGRALQGCN